MVHIYKGILFSHRKNELLPFAATWMDLDNIIRNEVSQRKTTLCDVTYMWNPEIIQVNLHTKQKLTQRHRKYMYGYKKGKGGGL